MFIPASSAIREIRVNIKQGGRSFCQEKGKYLKNNKQDSPFMKEMRVTVLIGD